MSEVKGVTQVNGVREYKYSASASTHSERRGRAPRARARPSQTNIGCT